MKFFSFDWLKSDERKELNKLREEKLKKEIKEEIIQEQIAQIPVQYSPVKPYSKLFLVNDIITIVFNDGSPYSRSGVDKSFADRVRECTTEAEIYSLLQPKIESKKEEELVQEIDEPDLSILKEDSRFIVEGKRVFFKGINLEIPSIIVVSFIEALEKGLLEEFTSLKYFWMWTALNPIESSRKDLYSFIQKNDIKITTNGLLVLYRRANLVENHNPLIDFISIQYFKYKHWKKSPKNYEIVENVDTKELKVVENGKIPDTENSWEFKGNLQELYLDLPNMQKHYLTDAHTGKLQITVGGVYSIPEEDVDIVSRNTCSRGLHVAAKSYNYGGFGNTPLLCIVNPSKVRSVPIGEEGKMRVSEMYVASILEIDDEGKYMDEDIDIVNFDQEYFNYTVEDLEEDLKNKSFESLVCQDAIAPLPLQSVINIIDILKNRVVLI